MGKKMTGCFKVDEYHWERKFGNDMTDVYLDSHHHGVAVARLTHNLDRNDAQLIANAASRIVDEFVDVIASRVGLELIVSASGVITKSKAAKLARLMKIACNEELAERTKRGTRSTEHHAGREPAGRVRSHRTRDGRQVNPVGRFGRG